MLASRGWNRVRRGDPERLRVSAGSNSHADSRPGARQERAAGVAHRIRQVPRATVLRYVPSPVAFPSSSNPGPRFASSALSCLVMYIQLHLRTAHQALRTIPSLHQHAEAARAPKPALRAFLCRLPAHLPILVG